MMFVEIRNRNFESFKNFEINLIDINYLNLFYLDGGLFLMNFMFVVRIYGYDICLIGGFNKKFVYEVFGIDSCYVFVLFILVGKVDELGYEFICLSVKEVIKFID